MGCGASSAKYPAGPPPPRVQKIVPTAAMQAALKLPIQKMGSIDSPISEGLALTYGSCTIPGYDPARPRRPNQDNSLIVEEFQHASQSLFAVMDGHGPVGHEVAAWAKRKLPKRLNRLLPKRETITEAIADAFTKTHDDVCASRVDCSISGFTITAVFLRGNELFVGNAGDCRAVLGRERGGAVTAIDLTVDHKPERPDERGESSVLSTSGLSSPTYITLLPAVTNACTRMPRADVRKRAQIRSSCA